MEYGEFIEYGEPEIPEFVPEAKAFERISTRGERFVPEKGGRAFIQAKTSAEFAISQIRMFLEEYVGKTSSAYQAIELELLRLPNIQYYNPKLLVVAAVFNYYNPELTKKAFDRFLQEHSDIINPKADVLRYIRLIRIHTKVATYETENVPTQAEEVEEEVEEPEIEEEPEVEFEEEPEEVEEELVSDIEL